MSAILKTSKSQLSANRRYQETHPDKIKTIYKKYYDTHADEVKQKKRERYAALTPEQRRIKRQAEYAKQKTKRIAAKLEKKLLLLQQSELITI